MNLLNDCVDGSEADKESNNPLPPRPRVAAGKLTALRNATIQAMSNLLSANIDSGLMHSIGEFLKLFQRSSTFNFIQNYSRFGLQSRSPDSCCLYGSFNTNPTTGNGI